MEKNPPCDVTVEVSTHSPPTREQRALIDAIQRVVEEFGVGRARSSLRTYLLHSKYSKPSLTSPARRGAVGRSGKSGSRGT